MSRSWPPDIIPERRDYRRSRGPFKPKKFFTAAANRYLKNGKRIPVQGTEWDSDQRLSNPKSFSLERSKDLGHLLAVFFPVLRRNV